MSDLVGNPEDRFSQNEAHIIPGCQSGIYIIFMQEIIRSIFAVLQIYTAPVVMNLMMHRTAS